MHPPKSTVRSEIKAPWTVTSTYSAPTHFDMSAWLEGSKRHRAEGEPQVIITCEILRIWAPNFILTCHQMSFPSTPGSGFQDYNTKGFLVAYWDVGKSHKQVSLP